MLHIDKTLMENIIKEGTVEKTFEIDGNELFDWDVWDADFRQSWWDFIADEIAYDVIPISDPSELTYSMIRDVQGDMEEFIEDYGMKKEDVYGKLRYYIAIIYPTKYANNVQLLFRSLKGYVEPDNIITQVVDDEYTMKYSPTWFYQPLTREKITYRIKFE